MCLLKSGYFEQIEEEQQQHQSSTHANNLICTWYEKEKEAYELPIPNHLIIVPFLFLSISVASDLGEAPTLELALIKPSPQEQHQHGTAVVNSSLNPAKWLCCERARSQSCRQLCYRVSSSSENTKTFFSKKCFFSLQTSEPRQRVDRPVGALHPVLHQRRRGGPAAAVSAGGRGTAVRLRLSQW